MTERESEITIVDYDFGKTPDLSGDEPDVNEIERLINRLSFLSDNTRQKLVDLLVQEGKKTSEGEIVEED